MLIPPTGGALGVPGGVVDERATAQIAGPHGHLAKAAGAARLERDRAAQPGEHEAVPVGLLEAEEAVLRALGPEDRGREVQARVDRDGDRRERLGPVPPRARHRRLRALRQHLVRLRVQRERARRAHVCERHGRKG